MVHHQRHCHSAELTALRQRGGLAPTATVTLSRDVMDPHRSSQLSAIPEHWVRRVACALCLLMLSALFYDCYRKGMAAQHAASTTQRAPSAESPGVMVDAAALEPDVAWAAHDPSRGLEWTHTLPADGERALAQKAIISAWARRAPDEAFCYLTALPVNPQTNHFRRWFTEVALDVAPALSSAMRQQIAGPQSRTHAEPSAAVVEP
jgi:hypothetical protein